MTIELKIDDIIKINQLSSTISFISLAMMPKQIFYDIFNNLFVS